MTLGSLAAGYFQLRISALEGKLNEAVLEKKKAEIERDVERLPTDKLNAELNADLGRK